MKEIKILFLTGTIHSFLLKILGNSTPESFLDLIDFQDEFSIDDFMAKYREVDEQLWPLVHEGKMTIEQLREERVRKVLDYYAIHYKRKLCAPVL